MMGHDCYDLDPMSVDPYANRELYIHLRKDAEMQRAAREFDLQMRDIRPGCIVCGAIDAKPCEMCQHGAKPQRMTPDGYLVDGEEGID